jgi:NAD(P)-dependent dehydrogenase (short-subunit alcohol dehydrogenase family)
MRTVLITGTSAGFGLLAAVELAKRGWRVVASMRNLERRGALDAALAESGAAQNVSVVQLDVTDETSIAKGVAETLQITGGFLDAVVNNAGVAAGGAFEDIPDAELRRVMDTNFFGVMSLTRALLPTFRKQRSGRIVVISSEAAFNGHPCNSI